MIQMTTLYQVTSHYYCAGFEVDCFGMVIDCTPIIWYISSI